MLIGTVARLQIQRSSLKIEGENGRVYDPAPIQEVAALMLESGGVVGRDPAGESHIDVHHRDHPLSKNRQGDNGISIGFISHYDLMRDRLGEHLKNGMAGENILVATDQVYTNGDLPERIFIETGKRDWIELINVQVAEPCVEFTRFAMRFPPDAKSDKTVTDSLEFLRGGMRGYYATYLGVPHRIAVGDQLHTPD